MKDKAAYDACDFSDAELLGGTRDGGGDGYEVKVDGTTYLGCSVSSHCSRSGQKIKLVV